MKTTDNIKKRSLGKSGIEVTPLAMGCWSFGGGAYWGDQSQSDVNNVVAAAIDSGVNMFDTAEMYNGGASETSLGIALSGKRDKAIVCSKLGPDKAYEKELIFNCEQSLKRLKMDYLDLYMLHWPINPISIKHFTEDQNKIMHPPTIDEAMHAMTTLKKQGKIRAIGLSNFGVLQLQEAVATGAQIDVNEMPYNILSRAIEQSILPYCVKNNISIVCSMALQQGLLADIYKSADDVSYNQAHSRHFANDRGNGTSRHGGAGYEKLMFETIDKIREIAKSAGITMPQLAIAWTLSKNGIGATLVGSRNVKELNENIKAINTTLSDNIINQVDEASEALRTAMGENPDYYESDENKRIW